ncbi:MAG: branched-chain amino acid transport system substrate-binding protein [Sphingobacteriales bacterium]|jgi:branched-chain amino acid transport system substrate-binding protein
MRFKIFLPYIIFFSCFIGIMMVACTKQPVEEIHIGYIGPLTTRATDLGMDPSRAMEMAVQQYNENREDEQPEVILHVEDDQWDAKKTLEAYHNMRFQHNIKVVFVSNSDGTVALQETIKKDQVILINPLNNDEHLSALNKNTFKIGKTTEEAHLVVGIRIIEMGLKHVAVLHYPNNFMTLSSMVVKNLLDAHGVKNDVIEIKKEQTDFKELMAICKKNEHDGLVFFGYKNLGFAMKQARDIGLNVPFFGSTVLSDPAYFKNSQGAIVNTECTYFSEKDGNPILAKQFLTDFVATYGKKPVSVWPAMQAFDSMNILLQQIHKINEESNFKKQAFDVWLRNHLFKVRGFRGVCGNISILEDGSSRGIYFSLYTYTSEGTFTKVEQ